MRAMLSSLLLAACATGVASAAGSSTIKANAAQLLVAGTRLEAAGNLSEARIFYQALLEDPTNDVRVEARFRLAMIDRAQGQRAEAAAALEMLLAERPEAQRVRLELAALLIELGQEGKARKLVHQARTRPLPNEVAHLVDRWAAMLDGRKPIGFSVDFALAPDSNVNRATGADRLDTVIGDFEIDPDSKSRSGLGVAGKAQACGRLKLGSNGRNALLGRFAGSTDLYRTSRFNNTTLALSAGPEIQVGRALLAVELGAGLSWYGGKAYSRQLGVSGRARVGFGPRTAGSASMAFNQIDNRRNRLQDGRSLALSGGIEHALSARNGIAANIARERFAARDAGYGTRSWRAGLSGWQELGPSTWFAGFELGRLEADERLWFLPEKRQDRFRRLTLGVAMKSIKVGPFSPVVRISKERNQSNVALTDYRRTRTEFALNRAF